MFKGKGDSQVTFPPVDPKLSINEIAKKLSINQEEVSSINTHREQRGFAMALHAAIRVFEDLLLSLAKTSVQGMLE